MSNFKSFELEDNREAILRHIARGNRGKAPIKGLQAAKVISLDASASPLVPANPNIKPSAMIDVTALENQPAAAQPVMPETVAFNAVHNLSQPKQLT